jgi:hypothetical protein
MSGDAGWRLRPCIDYPTVALRANKNSERELRIMRALHGLPHGEAKRVVLNILKEVLANREEDLEAALYELMDYPERVKDFIGAAAAVEPPKRKNTKPADVESSPISGLVRMY